MTALSCGRRELLWALKAALPHASRDKFIESLCCVRLEFAKGELFCIATDRYTLGAARVEADYDGEAVQVSLPTAEVRDLLRKLPDRDKDAIAVLEATDSYIELDGFYRFRIQSEITVPGIATGWVNWRKLLGPILRNPAAPPGDEFVYNAAYLARFASAARNGFGLSVLPVVGAGERKAAMTVVLADEFAGVIIAAAGGSNDVQLKHWRLLIPAEVKS